MPAQIGEALCVRQLDWSETSQVVWMFGRELGMVRALAKGSKRPKSPFRGGIELLSVGEMGVIPRPNSDLALLTHFDQRRSFPALRRSLTAFNAGLYVADLIAHLVHDSDPHPGLYDAAIQCLSALGNEGAIGEALVRLQWAALAEAGYRPELWTDLRTGEGLGTASFFLFHPALGGVLPDAGANGGAWRVRGATIELLRSIADAGGEKPRGGPTSMDTIDRANRLMASYARYILGSEPPTMRAVFGDRLMR